MKAGGPNLHFSEVVQAFLRTFREIGRPDLSLWYSEFGYTTYLYGGQREKGKYTFAAYTEEAQAVYLVRRYLYCFTRPEIKAALQYDFLDDFQGRQFDPEANFGLLRADYSPKPAYFALQNLATFFNGVRSDSRLDAQVKIDDQPLHRAGKRGQLLDWDEDGKALMNADNNIHARLFQTDGGLRLAVWDARPGRRGVFAPFRRSPDRRKGGKRRKDRRTRPAQRQAVRRPLLPGRQRPDPETQHRQPPARRHVILTGEPARRPEPDRGGIRRFGLLVETCSRV